MTAARWASASMVERNARTRAGSGFQSTYSGGSNAGNRRTPMTSFQLFSDLGEQAPFVGRDEGVGELERRGITRVGIRLEGPGERLLQRRWEVGPELAQPHRPIAQPRDHHLLRAAPLK